MAPARLALVAALALAGCNTIGEAGGGDDGDDGGGNVPGADAGPSPAIDATPPPPPPDAAPPLDEPEAKYHDFEEIESYLEAFADRRAHVQLDTYGTSTAGRPLYVVKISDNVAVDEDEPELLVNFAMHGDEIITVEGGLMLLYTLAERYHTDERVRALVDDHELFIVPVVSPDSFVARSRYVDGVDPNRNFPYPENPDRESIGIITAARDLFEAHDFAGTLDYHASGEFILLPYGASFDRPPTFLELEAIADILAEVAGYDPVQISHWLSTTVIGGSADYYYWKSNQGITLAVEIARSAAPPTSAIRDITDDVVEMTLRFIEQF